MKIQQILALALLASPSAHAIGGGGNRFDTCGPQLSLSAVRADQISTPDPSVHVSLNLFYQNCRTEIGTRFTRYGVRALVRGEGSIAGPVTLVETAERTNGSEYQGTTSARRLNENTFVADLAHSSHFVYAARRERATNVKAVTLKILGQGKTVREFRIERPGS